MVRRSGRRACDGRRPGARGRYRSGSRWSRPGPAGPARCSQSGLRGGGARAQRLDLGEPDAVDAARARRRSRRARGSRDRPASATGCPSRPRSLRVCRPRRLARSRVTAKPELTTGPRRPQRVMPTWLAQRGQLAQRRRRRRRRTPRPRRLRAPGCSARRWWPTGSPRPPGRCPSPAAEVDVPATDRPHPGGEAGLVEQCPVELADHVGLGEVLPDDRHPRSGRRTVRGARGARGEREQRPRDGRAMTTRDRARIAARP